jgi:hypothetical protein
VPEYGNAPAHQLQQFASRSTALVLLTPAQLDEPVFRAHVARETGLPPMQSRSLEGTLPYVEAVRDIGRQWAIPVCDCWELSHPNSSGQYDIFSDGLHLSPAGNARLYEALLLIIEKQYPSLRVGGAADGRSGVRGLGLQRRRERRADMACRQPGLKIALAAACLLCC